MSKIHYPVLYPVDAAASASGAGSVLMFLIVCFVLGCLLFGICCCCVMRYRITQYELPTTQQSRMHRKDVCESDSAKLWECQLCVFHNYGTRQACMLCGTDRNYPSKDLSFYPYTLPSPSLNPRQLAARRRLDWRLMRNSQGSLTWTRSGTSDRGSIGYVSEVRWTPTHPFGRMSPFPVDGRRAIMPYDPEIESVAAQPFHIKQAWFFDQLQRLGSPWEGGYFRMELERDRILLSSMEQLLWASNEQLHQCFRVKFRGEPGIDAGGLEREWCELMVQEIFSPDSKFFRLSQKDSTGYMIQPGTASEEHIISYQAIGRFFGRALFCGHLLDAHFCSPIYKHILGVPFTFSDLQFVDYTLYKNLKWMIDTDGAEELALDFSIVVPDSQHNEIVELKSNGRNISVTDENKNEYVKLLLEWMMVRSVSAQLAALVRGIHEVVPPRLLSVLDFQELELCICGTPEINVDDWESHSTFAIDRSKDRVVVQWFWSIVRAFSTEQRARLLQFTTGSSRVPTQGFKALTMHDGKICPFSIRVMDRRICPFPRVQTCFNRIDLPAYTTKADLQEVLTTILRFEITGFTIE